MLGDGDVVQLGHPAQDHVVNAPESAADEGARPEHLGKVRRDESADVVGLGGAELIKRKIYFFATQKEG